jgi:MFS family permease
LGSPVLGQLSDRIGRTHILRVGLLVFACVYLGFAMAREEWQFLVLFAVYGIYMAATDGVGKALAADLLGPTERGAGLGWLGFLSGICMIAASVVAGHLWDHVGAAAPFIYGTVGSLLALCGLSSIRDERTLPSN